MKVFMLQDWEKLGMKGQLVSVKKGFAENFLIPQKIAKLVSDAEVSVLEKVSERKAVAKEILSSKIAMTAARLKDLYVTVEAKSHDDGKLYASVHEEDIAKALAAKHSIVVNKKQVEISKTIKSIGEHTVTIKFSSKVSGELLVKVVSKK